MEWIYASETYLFLDNIFVVKKDILAHETVQI